ncbi:MAG TPA: helix-turn-helix domain-containing protein [Blastocatellia bacterium]|nr:helix-turn-helix domain-containing protein [Blastocatellia bacterium]
MPEKLLTVDELCAWLGESKQTVYEDIRRGRIPVVRIGKRIKADPETVRAWIARGGTPLSAESEPTRNHP